VNPSNAGTTLGPTTIQQKLVSSEHYFIITGASGAGKSALLEELQFLGHSIVPEAAREIIRAQTACGGRKLPMLDPLAFIAEVLALSIRDYETASMLKAPVFFDRGVPEARLHGVLAPTQYLAALERCKYNRRVFVTRPWAQIYVNDLERVQDYRTSTQWYEQNISVYAEAGYELCYIPIGTVRERVEFVLTHTNVCS
jgi:predicted ATPase